MRFEKCLKLQTNITFWYQLLISLRYKIEKLLCSEWLCFSNLALAKLVAVCVKAGKLLSWLSVHHIGHHTGAVRGHGLHRGGLEDGGGRVTVWALLLVSKLVVVCAEPAAAKPTRVGFLTFKEREHNEHVTPCEYNEEGPYQYVSSCAYSRWIYHIEFSHKSDTPFFLSGFPCLQFATSACNSTAAFEPRIKYQVIKCFPLIIFLNMIYLHWHWPWHSEDCWGQDPVARPRARL